MSGCTCMCISANALGGLVDLGRVCFLLHVLHHTILYIYIHIHIHMHTHTRTNIYIYIHTVYTSTYICANIIALYLYIFIHNCNLLHYICAFIKVSKYYRYSYMCMCVCAHKKYYKVALDNEI